MRGIGMMGCTGGRGGRRRMHREGAVVQPFVVEGLGLRLMRGIGRTWDWVGWSLKG